MGEKTEIEINVSESEKETTETTETKEPTVSEQAAEIVETATELAQVMARGQEMESRMVAHINELRGYIAEQFNHVNEMMTLIHQLTSDKIDDAVDDIVDDTEDIIDDAKDDAVDDIADDVIDVVADDVAESVDVITDNIDRRPMKRSRRWI